MDPSKALPAKFEHKNYVLHPEKFVEDIYELQNRSVPLAPNLTIKKDLDGTKSPSYDGIPGPTPQQAKNICAAMDKDHKLTGNLKYNVFSPKPAPTIGEFNTLSAPLFMDVDPKIIRKIFN